MRKQKCQPKYLIVWEGLDATAFGFGRTGGGNAGRRDSATSQDVRQDGGALHVLDQEWNHGTELRFAQRMTQGARPMDVVDGRVSVLI